MGKTIILTITKKYYEMILCGEKVIEYRKDIPYYDDKFSDAIDTIIFHYRKLIYIHCAIEKIVKIDRPKELVKSQFINTKKCNAIHIANVYESMVGMQK